MADVFNKSENMAHEFQVLTARELMERAFAPREILLAPWLPAKGLAMIYGPRGIGKTHVALGVAYAVATGVEFLGWKAPRPMRVLVIDGEMPAATLQVRLANIIKRSGAEMPSPDYLRFLPMDLQERGGINLANEADQREIAALLEGVDVIIVDNISTLAHNGRENEAESWLPIQEWALAQKRAGRSVLFVHHAGKGGQQRGTSRREDVLDTVVALRKSDNYEPEQGARFEVHYEKARGFQGDDAKPFEAALIGDVWMVRDLVDAKVDRVVKLKQDGLSIREIALETGISKSDVGRLLKKNSATASTMMPWHA